jgi:hypothetical protein
MHVFWFKPLFVAPFHSPIYPCHVQSKVGFESPETHMQFSIDVGSRLCTSTLTVYDPYKSYRRGEC